MLGAFGASFLDHIGASISTECDRGGRVTLTRYRTEAILTATCRSRPSRSWTYDDLDAAVDAWLRFDPAAEPVGWRHVTS